MSPFHATLLGIVEGLTEFLPVSSTGHLILVSSLLGVQTEAVKAFEVIMQLGAVGAVVGLYRLRIASMWRGLLGRDAAGRALLINLLIGFLPAAIVGVLLHRSIKAHLFQTGPVVAALAAGGVVMLGVDRWRRGRVGGTKTLDALTVRDAFVIGCAQCAALWPGTSRAMVTLLAGLLLGLPATVAVEFSFLLALPTLGMAALFDTTQHLAILREELTWVSFLCGFGAAAIVAAVAMRGFLRYMSRGGLAPFGWYRLGLAALVYWVVV